jgi:hypothetical protein
MIVLDTNVVSELMRTKADPKIVDWIDTRPAESIWLTSITIFEIRLGLETLADGRRRRRLEDAFDDIVAVDLRAACFISTILPRLPQPRSPLCEKERGASVRSGTPYTNPHGL